MGVLEEAAVVVAHPAQLRYFDVAVGLVDLEQGRVVLSERVGAAPLALELGEARPVFDLQQARRQVDGGLLQRVAGRMGQPRMLLLERGQQTLQVVGGRIARHRLSRLRLLLHPLIGDRLDHLLEQVVPDPPTTTGPASEGAIVARLRFQSELVGGDRHRACSLPHRTHVFSVAYEKFARLGTAGFQRRGGLLRRRPARRSGQDLEPPGRHDPVWRTPP